MIEARILLTAEHPDALADELEKVTREIRDGETEGYWLEATSDGERKIAWTIKEAPGAE